MTPTEVLQRALAEVYSGADRLDAEAVMDHLTDLGAEVRWVPPAQEPLPLASTRRMPKKANP